MSFPHRVMANLLYLAYALILSSRHEAGLEALGRAVQHEITFMPQWTRYGVVTVAAYLAAGITGGPHGGRKRAPPGAPSASAVWPRDPVRLVKCGFRKSPLRAILRPWEVAL
jgi:hypothetical protein